MIAVPRGITSDGRTASIIQLPVSNEPVIERHVIKGGRTAQRGSAKTIQDHCSGPGNECTAIRSDKGAGNGDGLRARDAERSTREVQAAVDIGITLQVPARTRSVYRAQ